MSEPYEHEEGPLERNVELLEGQRKCPKCWDGVLEKKEIQGEMCEACDECEYFCAI